MAPTSSTICASSRFSPTLIIEHHHSLIQTKKAAATHQKTPSTLFCHHLPIHLENKRGKQHCDISHVVRVATTHENLQEIMYYMYCSLQRVSSLMRRRDDDRIQPQQRSMMEIGLLLSD
eukprot:scaffold7330_cov146-Cylindrotheca_fusiformis.AAC.2